MLAVIFRDYEVVLAKNSSEESYENIEKKAWKAVNDTSAMLTLGIGKGIRLLFQKNRV